MKLFPVRLLLLLVVLPLTLPAWSAVRLPEVLGDHMVLQQNTEVTFWGWASVGRTIQVDTSWGEKAITQAQPDGSWQVKIKTPAAQPLAQGLRPEHVTFTMPEENVLQIHDVLIGEVWLCSGQSNMEMMLRPGYPPGWNAWYGEKYWTEESKNADRPYLRVFDVEKTAALTPQTDVKGLLPTKAFRAPDAQGLIPEVKRGWQTCTVENAPYFSAVAYYFGGMLAEKLQVPIGLVTSDVGGTAISTWMQNGIYYNGMIAPFFPMTLRGVVWYQGESNVGDPQYASLFPKMIQQWRDGFHQDKLPFYFVQIAPYAAGRGDANAQLREAQTAALQLPATGMVVTNDIGDPVDIHAKDKRDVGWRLANQALSKTYGLPNIEADGPTFASWKEADGNIDIAFSHTGGGLVSRDGRPLTCFTVAGPDGKFLPASATISGDDVVVSSPLAQPKELRFAWGEADEPNLMSKDGLPAAQFRVKLR